MSSSPRSRAARRGPRAERNQPAPPAMSVQVEVHDRHQLEIRLGYGFGGKQGPRRYAVDAFFFVPRNIGTSESNYSREQFYRDVTAHMRLDAAPLPLEQLADPQCPSSPLFRINQALEQLQSPVRPPPSRPVVVHVKLYAHLFAEGVKAEMKTLRRRLDEEAGWQQEGAAADFERRVESSLARMQHALSGFRRIKAAFAPFEGVSHQLLADGMRTCDEYMSLVLEEWVAHLAHALDLVPQRLDGSGMIARIRARLSLLAQSEAEHRARLGYLVLSGRTFSDSEGDERRPAASKRLSEGEYFTYRSGLLKKAVHQALYLDVREVKRDMFLRNMVGATAAALAAIWALALAMRMPSSMSDLPAGTQAFFFFAAVFAYVMKDRIKATTNEVLLPKLRIFDHSSKLTGASLESMGLADLEAQVRESMRFKATSELPSEVVKLRMARRTVRHAEPVGEEVIHYRKQLSIGSRRPGSPLPAGYRLRDILRLNVRPFLTRLDEPLDQVDYFDRLRMRFEQVDLPKVYHINLVLRVGREDGSSEGQVRLDHLRLVLNKEGIVRVERLAVIGPVPTEGKGLALRDFYPPVLARRMFLAPVRVLSGPNPLRRPASGRVDRSGEQAGGRSGGRSAEEPDSREKWKEEKSSRTG